MSEFSEKLSYYITLSGYNVYELAKEASLDRTTLQKTVKGQRLPSFDYIKDICHYIKISKKQSHNFLNIHFDRQSFTCFNEKAVQIYSSETETVKAIMCMIEQEIMEENAPEVYMDASWATPYVLSQLVQIENMEASWFSVG